MCVVDNMCKVCTHMLHLHLPDDHSCGRTLHCVGSPGEMLPFQCTAGYPVEYPLILHQNVLHDEPWLHFGTPVAGTQYLHHSSSSNHHRQCSTSRCTTLQRGPLQHWSHWLNEHLLHNTGWYSCLHKCMWMHSYWNMYCVWLQKSARSQVIAKNQTPMIIIPAHVYSI